MTAEEYVSNPCRASALPFWKTERLIMPQNMLVVCDDEFDPAIHTGADTPYFKLIHDLKRVEPPRLPAGFRLSSCDTADFARHIEKCYSDIGVTEGELSAYRTRFVHDPALWVCVREIGSGALAATGIAELDPRIGEGALEWIQVSPEYRRGGLGRSIVNELLSRLSTRAAFVTVSGRADDPLKPVLLYKACGFTGETLWHVIREN